MKIQFLITQDIESPSGLGRFFPMARELTKKGHQVTISALHPSFNSLNQKSFYKEGVRINYIAPMYVKKYGNSKDYYPLFRFVPIAIWEIIAFLLVIIKENADLLFVGKPHPMNTLPAFFLRLFNNKKIWVDCDDYEAATNRFQKKWQYTIISSVERYFVPRGNYISANTQFMVQKAIAWGGKPENVLYLPNGIDIERFPINDQSELSKIKDEIGFNEKPIVGFVGSISFTSHPVDLLVSAFSIVASRLPEVRLLLVGGGENFSDLKRLVDKLGLFEKVYFTGRVSPEEAGKYYKIMTVSIDPVHDNTVAASRSPLKMFESWHCGVPFVTGDVGDRRLLSGDPPASMIVPPGDVENLANAIVTIITNAELSNKLRLLGYERVKNFSWSNLISTIEPKVKNL